MTPKEPEHKDPQSDLFRVELTRIIDRKHPLVKLASEIQWDEMGKTFELLYCDDNGREAKPTRLMVGLHYLKHTYNLSDDAVLEQWVENPYWQYFCGMKFFVHRLPTDTTTMVKWRKRVNSAGGEAMLKQTISTGLKCGFIRPSMFKRINVDTTVQEKAIRYPTDARLYDRMRQRLVKMAQQRGIVLRQSYQRKGPQVLRRQHGYAHAQQFKRAARMTKQLRTYLGRICRDIQRKAKTMDSELTEYIQRAERLLAQQRHDKNKLYSIHAPEVECIAKGKVHQRYEFGCKVGLACTSRGSWVLASAAFHQNPYDGHTLEPTVQQARRTTDSVLPNVFCDLGYRGHPPIKGSNISVVPRKKSHLPKALQQWMNRRSAIEPTIGHMKADHRMDRNLLKGKLGDQLNALFSACGYNFRKLLRAFFFPNWISTLFQLVGFFFHPITT
jgi:IS5 family transposase